MLSPEALTLNHWLSPAFPTGAFAYSHGLEQVIARGDVTDAPGLEYWLADVLRFGSGWQDSVLLACALADGADTSGLDALCHALQPCAERLQETQEQGAAFARTVAQITGRDLPPRTLPIAVAEAAAPLGLAPQTVIAAYLQAFLTNLVTIGIRHVPLGQGAGHGVLARLLPLVPALAQAASLASADDLGNCCLGADMAAMEHETKDVRLFRT
ncbi:urease accessory protein UreF [Roseinatronobacter monicus]|uniref:Urease accessory protein UreF n=1 Tax=Roseinatronobacter monicus TaxID=393481 RepID=A0A543KG92_9RHOB|nr:urease accessory UreF family protein [Roseinatronobacter monicus]TQM94099.1 urease accessory protein [Roseinatronobacter monicus]